MFYKIAKILSKTAIVFGFMCMVGGCSDLLCLQLEHMRMNTSGFWNIGTGKER